MGNECGHQRPSSGRVTAHSPHGWQTTDRREAQSRARNSARWRRPPGGRLRARAWDGPPQTQPTCPLQRRPGRRAEHRAERLPEHHSRAWVSLRTIRRRRSRQIRRRRSRQIRRRRSRQIRRRRSVRRSRRRTIPRASLMSGVIRGDERRHQRRSMARHQRQSVARHQRPSTAAADGGAPSGEAKVDARVAFTIVPCLNAALPFLTEVPRVLPRAGPMAAALSASLSARSITCATSGVTGGHQRPSETH
jgi:hypothetical protein